MYMHMRLEHALPRAREKEREKAVRLIDPAWSMVARCDCSRLQLQLQVAKWRVAGDHFETLLLCVHSVTLYLACRLAEDPSDSLNSWEVRLCCFVLRGGVE